MCVSVCMYELVYVKEHASDVHADRENAQRFVEKFSRTLTPNRCVLYVCVYVCMYICMCTYIHTKRTKTNRSMYVCDGVCKRTCK